MTQTYSTGKPCRNGHACERYVSTGCCIECVRLNNQKPNVRRSQLAYRARPETKLAEKRYCHNKRQAAIANLPPPIKAGHCDLCERPRVLHWDHSHALAAQGYPPLTCHRGWLCMPCNTAIGKLGDDAAGLQRALDYVRQVP